jgi:histidinol phosphatase-like PHP family hydrolase
MIIRSDWHIHSEASYDATLPLEEIIAGAERLGYEKIGITDHANFNDEKFLSDLRLSAKNVKEIQKKHPNVILGVELTPIEKPEFDYIARTGTREGYVAPTQATPFDIELAQTKEELMALGVRYAIGAAHWRVDVPGGRALQSDVDTLIREWHRQQMWLACDERVTILGHPWYHGRAIWYDDLSVIPRSMNMDIAAALKENGKRVECNSHFFWDKRASERFRHQYAEFLRELFEMGIPVTYGSDSHEGYADARPDVIRYLSAAGFADGEEYFLS